MDMLETALRLTIAVIRKETRVIRLESPEHVKQGAEGMAALYWAVFEALCARVQGTKEQHTPPLPPHQPEWERGAL